MVFSVKDDSDVLNVSIWQLNRTGNRNLPNLRIFITNIDSYMYEQNEILVHLYLHR